MARTSHHSLHPPGQETIPARPAPEAAGEKRKHFIVLENRKAQNILAGLQDFEGHEITSDKGRKSSKDKRRAGESLAKSKSAGDELAGRLAAGSANTYDSSARGR